MTAEGTETLRSQIAAALIAARDRTTALTDCVDEANLVRQHSPLMSPLVWDLAHIANQEEMWLLRAVGGQDPIHPEIDPLYDAFEHPRSSGRRCHCSRRARPARTRPTSVAGCSTSWPGPGSPGHLSPMTASRSA